jgi:hypothetical protein
MAKEIVSFLDHLEVFVLSDDEARWKAMRWIMLVCGVGGSIDLLQGSSVDEVVFLMGAVGLIMTVAWITWYCSIRPVKIWRL